MSGKTDVVKGRIKEVVGALTGNERLREEGKSDQAIGKVKQAAQKAVDEGKDAAKKTVGKAKDVAKRAVAKSTDDAK